MARVLFFGYALMITTSVVSKAESLTKDNFEQEAFDSGKSAFVKFQAPW